MQPGMTDLLRCLRRVSGSAMLTVSGIALAMNLLMLGLPIYSLQIYDRVLTSRSEATLFYLTLITVVLISAYGFLEAIRLKLLLRIGNRFQLAYEPQTLDACVAQSARVSEPVIHPLRDLAVVKNFLASPQGIVSLIDTPLALVFLVVVFFIHPLLAGAMAVGVLLLMALALATEWSTANPVKAANEASLKAQAQANEIVANAEVIEAMGMRQAILGYWQRHSRETLHHQSLGGDRSATLTAIGRWVRLILSITLTALGAYLAIDNRITIGGMIASSILMGRGLAPLENLIPLWRQLVGVRTSWDRLNGALRRYPRVESSMSLPAPSGALSLEQVTYVPAGFDAPTIKGISFSLPAGSLLGLMGPVSAGKSTLAKLICGIWKPRTGVIRLDQADVYQWNRSDFGRYVGYLPQDANIISGTVRENIARFGEATDEDVVAAAQLCGVHEMILRLPRGFGYDTFVGRGGATLSGGMRQRVGLARALLGNPKLVVLDEPTANLDVEGEQALFKALAELRGRGATVVVVTHQLAMLRDADFIGVIVEGQLKTFGPRNEILKQAAPQPVQLVRPG